jgi:glyoxylase-like metal-dependent hydrolase (beta-lactamase superfamily II)
MQTQVKKFSEMVKDGSTLPSGWDVRAIVNDDNMTYLAFHTEAREAIFVDPMREDLPTLLEEAKKLQGYRFLAVIDTHTHADHVSSAADLAAELHAPVVQHERGVSRRIHLRVSRDTQLPSVAGPLEIWHTPGHTPDSITVVWGPFVMTGDHLLYGDTGRDDLPGGDPEAHYESLQKLKARLKPNHLLLFGHDAQGGRITNWKTQLEVSPSLTQDRATFVREAGAYEGPSPKNLKESLFYNFK